jgi:hypothetical protein
MVVANSLIFLSTISTTSAPRRLEHLAKARGRVPRRESPPGDGLARSRRSAAALVIVPGPSRLSPWAMTRSISSGSMWARANMKTFNNIVKIRGRYCVGILKL